MERRRHPGAIRRVAAVLVFAACFSTLFPVILLSCTALLAYETLRWLLLSVLLVPAMTALGLWGLLFGLPLIGLLVGAIAIRWPDRSGTKLSVAILLPMVELMLVRQHGVPWLASRTLPLLIAPRTIVLLGTVAPALSSGLAALLVPRRLIRRVLQPPAW